MPQTPGPEVRARAAELRAAGTAAVARHLAAQAGRRHAVLMETPRLGRTGQFAEVAFAEDHPPGRIVDTVIAGHDGARLLAG